ncbi:hypothetical protein ACFCW2_01400 [Qipengyuania sp. DSG2-2]|uniref:hypothetical protein n=1 Tax=Qipengyuania sp. DGS2-2 TaxID=3349631 RepID=UPI0036D2769E
MDPLKNFPWLYDTSVKNILRHLAAGAGAALFFAGYFSWRGIPTVGASGPMMLVACIAVYGLVWGCVLTALRIRIGSP